MMETQVIVHKEGKEVQEEDPNGQADDPSVMRLAASGLIAKVSRLDTKTNADTAKRCSRMSHREGAKSAKKGDEPAPPEAEVIRRRRASNEALRGVVVFAEKCRVILLFSCPVPFALFATSR
jgi:hypothetical protein